MKKTCIDSVPSAVVSSNADYAVEQTIPNLIPNPLFVAPLLSYYQLNKRDLPWRHTQDPYAVWVSEIMLQQTRVEAVIPYYCRFLEALPNIDALADCSEAKLLKLWEGLGYYSRVKNMQKTAKILVAQGQNTLPLSKAELQKLPGIGSYTASAIASIVGGEAVPAVDGNVLRVTARLCNNGRNILDPDFKSDCETALFPLVPTGENAGIFNQAMMELGATICLPRTATWKGPKCDVCPIRNYCEAYRCGTQYDLPLRLAKTQKNVENLTIFIIKTPRGVLLRKRPPKGLLGGMYEFPNTPEHLTKEEAVSWVVENVTNGQTDFEISSLPPHRHIFTHKIWEMTAYLICTGKDDISVNSTGNTGDPFVMFNVDSTEEDYPLPSAFAPYRQLLV